jgi:DNA-binding winged helix-turn-helix (wHTH) protein
MATEPLKTAEQVRFGDGFELDSRAYELRRAGRVLKLERIPMELLLLLVEERGHLVSRDRIIDRVWGKDVFLDTDNSINAAVRKVRQVLRDDPERPHFVQTVTGRGYRFIAQVEEAGTPTLERPLVSAPAGETPVQRESHLHAPGEKHAPDIRVRDQCLGGLPGTMHHRQHVRWEAGSAPAFRRAPLPTEK